MTGAGSLGAEEKPWLQHLNDRAGICRTLMGRLNAATRRNGGREFSRRDHAPAPVVLSIARGTTMSLMPPPWCRVPCAWPRRSVGARSSSSGWSPLSCGPPPGSLVIMPVAIYLDSRRVARTLVSWMRRKAHFPLVPGPQPSASSRFFFAVAGAAGVRQLPSSPAGPTAGRANCRALTLIQMISTNDYLKMARQTRHDHVETRRPTRCAVR